MIDIKKLKEKFKLHKKSFIVFFIGKSAIKLFVVYVLLSPNFSVAESVNSFIRKGNKLYDQAKYNQATEQYSYALEKEPNNAIANFNQADAIYQIGNYEQAQEYFNGIANSTNNSEIKFKSKFNLGNCYYKQEKYEESVRAYKDALKINPKDKDAKYNLMMAMAKLKKQENQQDKQNKDNKQDKQDQDQKKQQQNKQQNQNQEKDNPNNSLLNPENQEDKEIQNLLDMAEGEEDKTLDEMIQQKENGKKVKVQKDW